MPLHPKLRQHLKVKAHNLHPIVLLGNQGLTPAVIKEIDRALFDHELIKIKYASSDRIERAAVFGEISQQLQAELVQCIGKIGVFYRQSTKST